MADFRSTGQKLTGSSGIINQDQYEGCPRPYNAEMQIGRTEADADPHIGLHGAGSPTTGPHSSNLMNKADPRVDSDRDGHRGMGTGMTGSHTTAGPHSSDMMNKADPRVDSDRDGSHRGVGTGMTGSSTGSKLDPRVDSHHTGESRGILSSEHLGGTAAPGSHSAVFGLTPKDTRGTDTSPLGHHDRSVGGTDGTPLSGHTSSHATGVSDTSSHKKPSLIDRLNPMKDTDGDGKKGFMK